MIAFKHPLAVILLAAVMAIHFDACLAQDAPTDPDQNRPQSPDEQSPDAQGTREQVPSLLGSVPTPRSDRTLEYWASQLSNERFLRRQSARRHLIGGGRESVPVLQEMIDGGDLETVENVISILAKIAEEEEPWETGGALSTLEEIADSSFGTKATLAKSTLKSFAEQRGRDARVHLKEAGVYVGTETVALGSRSTLREIVRIDEKWDGNVELLAWLRWVGDVNFVIIEGDAVNPKVMKAVARMPNLTTLVLVESELSVPTVEVLQQLPRIDAIELRYIPLSEDVLAALSKIRIRNSLFLMGADVSEKRVERLRVELPGLEITRRLGGFLGVLCRTTLQDICEVSEVMLDSGADEAGLRSGDTIIRIDGKKITRFDDLQKQINTHRPGDKVSIRYRRNGDVYDTTATLKKLQNR